METDFFNDFEKVDMSVKGVRLPTVKIPEEYIQKFGLDENISSGEFLRVLVRHGLQEKGLYDKPEYIARVKREFKVLVETGLDAYILLVWDIVNFCKEKDIPIGKGRGSVGGSLIAYIVGIVGIDAIENKLIFERFISEARATKEVIDGQTYLTGALADIDTDFCTDRRGEVIEYLKQKYFGKFCKLPTISTLTTKSVIKDVSKIFGRFTEDELNVITKYIPVKYGQPLSIENCIKESPQFEEFASKNEDIIDCALTLEDMMRQKGSHASAYLVGHDNFEDYLPCELDLEGEIVCSFDMEYAQQETIKLDLLGLHGVTLIDNIEKSLGKKFDDFNPNDPEIYSMSSSGDLPYGLFQLGANTNYKVFRQVNPKNWDELMAVIGLARPGSLAYVGDYVKNEYNDYWGNVKMQELLGETHGVPIFQETTMAICSEVFGFSLGQADELRKIIGKKLVTKVKEWEEKIYTAAKEKGIPEELAKFFWNLLEESANYSFNKCLSPSTVVEFSHGFKMMSECSIGEMISFFNPESQQIEFTPILDIVEGEQDLYEVTFDDGSTLSCSMEHKLMVEDFSMVELKNVLKSKKMVICE